MTNETNWPDLAIDEEGYPTTEALQFIESYDMKDGVEGLVNFIGEIWYHGDLGFYREGNNLELHTLGWSGNEDVIRSLRKTFFWTFCWLKSEKGGHHYFDNLDRFRKNDINNDLL